MAQVEFGMEGPALAPVQGAVTEATPGLRLEGGSSCKVVLPHTLAPPLAPGQLTELLPQGSGHTVGKPMVFFF